MNRYDAECLRTEMKENKSLTKFIFHQKNIIAELDAEDTIKARLIKGHAL
ncbi:MAG: hypothetical protein AB9856_06370 [Cellulosilyticaceae bacterium]